MDPVYTALRSGKAGTTIFLAVLLLLFTARGSAQTFSSQSSTSFPTNSSTPRNVVTDFDADGDADILIQTGLNGSSFNYARNNGNGTFTIVAQSSSPFASVTLPDVSTNGIYRTADFDADGDLDIWVPAASATGTYLRNDGSSFSLQSSSTFPNPTATGRNIVADYDGDGDADVLFQTGGDGSAFSYARNDGNATFTILAQSSSPFASVTLPNASAIGYYRPADYDGDGDIDIWVAADGATGTYFRNDGSSFSSQPTTTFPAAASNARNVVGDFDADGDADILYQTGTNGSSFSYARSNGNGTFTIVAQSSSPFASVTLPDVSLVYIYRIDDLDDDGDMDIWVPSSTTTGTYLMQDGSPPTLTSTSPANDAVGVLRDANINLNFSETVTKNTGTITIVRSSDNTVIETITVTSGQVTGSGTAYVINPGTTLASNTTYSVRITGGAFLDAASSEFPALIGGKYQFTTGTALPLFWLNVNAVLENDQVNISWKTTGEGNTSHFEVERSTDGLFYNNIAQIASANSPGEHQYNFADKQVQPGYTYYYRLKQVDLDGRFNYSSTLKVDIGGERTVALKITNNPVRADMIIAITLPHTQNARLVLVNQIGATVLERKENMQAGETIMTVRTSNLPTGVYYLILYAGPNELRTTVIKQ
jgi:uncharacterized membrane protein